LLELDSIEWRFADAVTGDDWQCVERAVERCDAVFLMGNGVNLAVAPSRNMPRPTFPAHGQAGACAGQRRA